MGQVAEPRLEYVYLGLRDRDMLGPVVGGGPGRKVVLGRPTDTRPRLDGNIKVIGQHAQAGARSGHPCRIALHICGGNGRSLSHDPLSPPGSLAVLADGGCHVDFIDVLVKTYGESLRMDGQKVQSFQCTARTGWRRFSLAVQFPVRSTLPAVPCLPPAKPSRGPTNPLDKRAITPLIAQWIAAGFGHENHVGARGEERLWAC